jgi:hypothetical protein
VPGNYGQEEIIMPGNPKDENAREILKKIGESRQK